MVIAVYFHAAIRVLSRYGLKNSSELSSTKGVYILRIVKVTNVLSNPVRDSLLHEYLCAPRSPL